MVLHTMICFALRQGGLPRHLQTGSRWCCPSRTRSGSCWP
jgi:hypothetical protein